MTFDGQMMSPRCMGVRARFAMPSITGRDSFHACAEWVELAAGKAEAFDPVRFREHSCAPRFGWEFADFPLDLPPCSPRQVERDRLPGLLPRRCAEARLALHWRRRI